MPKFNAGQYLSFKIEIGGQTMLRNYSISCGENAQEFRISVKKEILPPDHPGIVSNHLHNDINVGDILEVSAGFYYFLAILELQIKNHYLLAAKTAKLCQMDEIPTFGI